MTPPRHSFAPRSGPANQPDTQGSVGSSASAPSEMPDAGGGGYLKEFLREQLPLLAVVTAVGVAAYAIQHGTLPTASPTFPLAGVGLWPP